MHLCWHPDPHDPGRRLDVSPAPGRPLTVGDLLAALGRPDAPRLSIDGCPVGAETALSEAGLAYGACIHPIDTAGPTGPPGPESSRSALATPTVEVIAGPDAGGRMAVPAAGLVVGRRGDLAVDDATVSRRHARIEAAGGGATIVDLAATNGTALGGRWAATPLPFDDYGRLGATYLTVGRTVDDAPHPLSGALGRDPSGVMLFNRPPRRHAPEATCELEVPRPPAKGTRRTPLAVARVALPILMGSVMAVLFGPRMALFLLLSPLLAIGTWWSNRRRARREDRLTAAGHVRAMARFAEAAATAHRVEIWRRRGQHPHLAEIARRATVPSVRLWERRLDHRDALCVHVGLGPLPWSPDLGPDPAPEVGPVIEALGPLADVPIEVHLDTTVGIVGDRDLALRAARSLVAQAAVLHGPADLGVVVLTSASAAASWEWTGWLPHTRDPATEGRTRRIAAGRAAVDALAASLPAPEPDRGAAPHLLCVVDGDGLTLGRASAARALLAGRAGPAGGIVVAATPDQLPALCTTVVEVLDARGTLRVVRPADGTAHEGVALAGLGEARAEEIARRLARYDDPELELRGAAIPDHASLLDLLGLDEPDPASLAERWSRHRDGSQLRVPIGVDEHGPFELDLVADGPHALVGGTTGSGKSELLRSFVAALAATYDPDTLNVVLVDYKGGSAFDRCSALPHCVGLVTDLDPHLGARALTCLEAELHRRERLLRTARADDLVAYRRATRNRADAEPLPRLVVVIDEFATLTTELPDFVDALVDIAQRGRSLGVHLVLATQRPSGAVRDSIRTNTNVRVALRVLDAADSKDVVGTPAAASISRRLPGRAFARLGPSEVMGFQSALVTGSTPTGSRPAIVVRPVVAGVTVAVPAGEPGADPGGATSDLDRLVTAAAEAHRRSGRPDPRRPWPEPLASRVDLDRIGTATGDGVVIGLADDPANQRQVPWTWDPGTGHLLCFGLPGSGPTGALTTVALALAASSGPEAVHLYALDFGTGELGQLAELPHCGAVVGSGERERQVRLLGRLESEVRRRKALAAEAVAGEPRVVTLIDNHGAFTAAFDRVSDAPIIDGFARVFADGAAVGVHLAISADRVAAVASAMQSVTPNRLLFRLTDPAEYRVIGRRGVDPASLPAGRAFAADTATELQLATPDSVASAVGRIAVRHPPTPEGPPPIGVLDHDLPAEAIVAAARREGGRWSLPIARTEPDLGVSGVTLHPGDHVLITGPTRSGKSTALATLSLAVAAADPHVRRIAVCGRHSPLPTLADVDRVVTDARDLAAAVDELLLADAPAFLFVDDADRFDDADHLTRLLGGDVAQVHVVASGRADRLRGQFRHWTAEVRRTRVGVLLRPDDLDGDLLGVRLPTRAAIAPIPGRGWLVTEAGTHQCQVARPVRTARP